MSFFASTAFAQEGFRKVETLDISELEQLKLRVAQQEAMILQLQEENLQLNLALVRTNRQQALQQLDRVASDVKAVHGFGDDVQFDPTNLTFTKTEKKAEAETQVKAKP